MLVDIKSTNIIHSVAKDCTVLSYDLKAAKRIISHLITGGTFSDMTQRKDNENELITCDNQGRLLHWDIDFRDPVLAIKDPSTASLECCAVSPSGKYLAFSGEDTLIKVLDLQTNEVISVGKAHSDLVNALMWTNDERHLVTIGNDTCLCIWQFRRG